MAAGWELSWREVGDPTSIGTVSELDDVLHSTRREPHGDLPPIATLTAPDGKWMGIGLDEPSVATFQYGADPPYLVSVGAGPPAREPFVFSFQGHWTEFGPEAAIPLDHALRALREFFVSGGQPRSIKWREV